MTFVLIVLRRSGNFLLRNDTTKNVRNHALQALFPVRRGLLPARELLRKFRSPGLPPPLLPALQGGRIRGGGVSGCTWCCVLWGFLPSRSTSVQREGWKCLWTFVCCARARLCLFSSQSSGLPLPAPLPRLLLPAHHRTLCDVMNGEMLWWTAPVLDPPVFPDLRIEEQGRIVEPILDRAALVTVTVFLALALLTVRG